jgi:YebC/PmpR family DNA-binding regulatory protein
MSGHSHWAGIKHKKEITDHKRGKIFSKILSAISSAARPEPNSDFNPRLRTMILKAKELAVPQENIERAILKAKESAENLEDLIFEAYGPGGVAILIHAISDNRNRTVQEIKLILKEHNGKWAETGSVQWAFEPKKDSFFEWEANFQLEISEEDKNKLGDLVETLEENDSIQNVFVNTNYE